MNATKATLVSELEESVRNMLEQKILLSCNVRKHKSGKFVPMDIVEYTEKYKNTSVRYGYQEYIKEFNKQKQNTINNIDCIVSELEIEIEETIEIIELLKGE